MPRTLALYKNNPLAQIVSLFTASLTFTGLFNLMANLPGTYNESCVMGAGLNPFNIAFSILLSLAVGILLASMVELLRRHQQTKASIWATGGTLGIGGIVGMLTVFCTLCTLPLITLAGTAIGLTWFTTYNTLFKLVSLGLMTASLNLAEHQLALSCKICVK